MATASVKTRAAKVGGAAKRTAGKAGSAVKTTAAKAGSAAKTTAGKAGTAIKDTQGPSPNPMTNLVIADIAMRGGGRLLRHLVERTVLGVKYPPDKARDIVKGRSMTQTLLGTAVARIATRSVPGALLVGGGLIAKTLYDRSKKRRAALLDCEAAIEDQARDA
jgi:hypothetical protein